MEISWTDRVRNEEVAITHSQVGNEYPSYSKKEGRITELVTYCLRTAF